MSVHSAFDAVRMSNTHVDYEIHSYKPRIKTTMHFIFVFIQIPKINWYFLPFLQFCSELIYVSKIRN